MRTARGCRKSLDGLFYKSAERLRKFLAVPQPSAERNRGRNATASGTAGLTDRARTALQADDRPFPSLDPFRVPLAMGADGTREGTRSSGSSR